MDLRDLRCIAAVAETGSFLGAAETLHMSQPSVSARMRDLELRLGLALFERLPRGVQLTREGAALLEHARTIIRQFDEAEADMQAHRQSPVGLVRVGLPTSLTALLAIPVLEACMAALPDVKLRIVESMSGYIAQWLREDRLDLGLLFGSTPPQGLHSKVLVEEDLLVAGADDESLQRLRDDDAEVPFQRLSELPLILPGPEHGLRSLVEAEARRNAVALRVVVEIDAFREIRRLVSRGFGYTILSSAAVPSGRSFGIATARVKKPAISRVVNLAHPAVGPVTRATREVALQIEKIVQEKTMEERWFARAL